MSATHPAAIPATLLLARWWSRPTPAELSSWAELWPEARETARGLELGGEAIEQLHAAAEAADPELLIDEYERLLVGPGRAPCAPYESLWRNDAAQHEQGMLMGAAADAVERIYRGLGVRIRGEAHELPDHLLVEWEALAYALHHDATKPADALLHDHLSIWMAPFCDAVAGETHEQYYATLAELTSAWTAALAG